MRTLDISLEIPDGHDLVEDVAYVQLMLLCYIESVKRGQWAERITKTTNSGMAYSLRATYLGER